MNADIALAASFSERRPEALAEAYDRYGKVLYTTAYRVLGNVADAQDCVHDSFVQIWTKQGTYAPAKGTLGAFLIVCVRNLAISRMRTAARRAKIDKSLVHDEAEYFDIPDPIEQRDIRLAISKLPHEIWEPLRLAYVEYLTHAEISARLGIPLGTAKGRISQGMRRLRAALTEKPAHEIQ